ncbi:MAG: O-antigen ligase family protein [Candidatus Pacebacteria bacterium]|nr:O-antigen ligase family protein [Candidatus Paceibacterota bacterium]
MGKNSRLKRERRLQNQSNQTAAKEEKQISSGWEKFLIGIITAGAYLSLLTPLIYSKYYYFPFVGPKSLYFMAFCQIIFFAWVILALYKKKYRPKFNAVLLAFGLFIFFMAVSTISGVDPSRSFWSKFERMTGLLMWLNIFGFLLAVSSTFKTFSQWKRIFFVSLGIAFVVSLLGLLEKLGVKAVTFSDRGGSTLGNTSFLGSYLIFNFFLAIYLFTQERKEIFVKIGLGFSAVLSLLVIYLQGARAALAVSLGGLILIGLLFLAFKIKNKLWSTLGKIVLGAAVLIVIASIVLLYLPNNPVHNIFGKMATQGRFANWGIAQRGFLERPFFGWGPETYDILFPKYFNPCLFTSKCGGEFWFDRTHNIILDTLVAMGAFGFFAYLGIFFGLIWVLIKKYFKEKSIDFWTFALFCALPAAYFIQNLTVFDMVSSLTMFALILSFGAFLATLEKPEKFNSKLAIKGKWALFLVLIIFVLTFNYFILKPWQLDKDAIKAVQAQYQDDRLALYDKTLSISPLGKYQITDFFADHSQSLVQGNLKEIDKENAIKELNWAIQAMEKRHSESPLDYRIVLKLAQLYNSIVVFDSSKLPLAEQYSQMALKMSPTNQQSYWVLAQTKLFQQDQKTANELVQKAIDLELGVLNSYKIAAQVAMISGNRGGAVEIAQRAVAFNKDWLKEFSDLLPQESPTSTNQ